MSRVSQKKIVESIFMNKDVLQTNLLRVGYDQNCKNSGATFLAICRLVKIYFPKAKATGNLVNKVKKKLMEEQQSRGENNLNEVSYA